MLCGDNFKKIKQQINTVLRQVVFRLHLRIQLWTSTKDQLVSCLVQDMCFSRSKNSLTTGYPLSYGTGGVYDQELLRSNHLSWPRRIALTDFKLFPALSFARTLPPPCLCSQISPSSLLSHPRSFSNPSPREEISV